MNLVYSSFRGMDQTTDPGLLRDGFVQRLTNLVCRSGSLQLRKGRWKMHSTALASAPVMGLFRARINGVSTLLAACGGKVFKNVENAPAEIARLRFNDKNRVRFIQVGDVVYMSDGETLQRMDKTGVLPLHSFLAPPITPSYECPTTEKYLLSGSSSGIAQGYTLVKGKGCPHCSASQATGIVFDVDYTHCTFDPATGRYNIDGCKASCEVDPLVIQGRSGDSSYESAAVTPLNLKSVPTLTGTVTSAVGTSSKGLKNYRVSDFYLGLYDSNGKAWNEVRLTDYTDPDTNTAGWSASLANLTDAQKESITKVRIRYEFDHVTKGDKSEWVTAGNAPALQATFGSTFDPTLSSTDRYYRFTHYDTATGVESKPGDELHITFNSRGYVRLTFTKPSGLADSVKVRIYRQVAGVYKPVYEGAYDDTGTLAWTDKYSDKEVMDLTLSFGDLDMTQIPPPAWRSAELWRNRLWLGGCSAVGEDGAVLREPMTLYVSRVRKPETYSDEELPDTDPESAGKMTLSGNSEDDAIVRIISSPEERMNQLLVFTQKKVYAVSGYDWRDFTVMEVSPHGCIGPETVAQTEYGVLWLSKEGVCRFPNDGDALLSKEITPFLGGFLPSDIQSAVGFYYNRQYYLGIPGTRERAACTTVGHNVYDDASAFSAVFDTTGIGSWDDGTGDDGHRGTVQPGAGSCLWGAVYDFQVGGWRLEKNLDVNCAEVWRWPGDQYLACIGGSDGFVRQIETLDTDDGTPIYFDFLGPWEGGVTGKEYTPVDFSVACYPVFAPAYMRIEAQFDRQLRADTPNHWEGQMMCGPRRFRAAVGDVNKGTFGQVCIHAKGIGQGLLIHRLALSATERGEYRVIE